MNTAELLPRESVVNVVRPSASPRTTFRAGGDTRCSTCPQKDKCLPANMQDADALLLDGLKFARRTVREGEALFDAGQKFGFIYAVRAGTLKTVLGTREGGEQVSGFSMAGDILGLDGLASGMHSSTAIALEDSEVCAIPYTHLLELGAQSPRMHATLFKLMSGEIVREHSLMLMLGSMTADERVATFLLNISDRMKARGWSATEFHLRMWRADIGSYLGLTLETVSRTLSSFQRQRLLVVDKRHIRVLDIDALRAMSVQTTVH